MASRSSPDHSSDITLRCVYVDSEHTDKTNGKRTYEVKGREAGPVSAVDEPFAITSQPRILHRADVNNCLGASSA